MQRESGTYCQSLSINAFVQTKKPYIKHSGNDKILLYYVQDRCLSCNTMQPQRITPLKNTRDAHCKARGAKTAHTSAEREEMREAQKKASQIWPPYSELECYSAGEWGVETWSHVPIPFVSHKRKVRKETRTRKSVVINCNFNVELSQILTQQITFVWLPFAKREWAQCRADTISQLIN